jgi:hypothetical protein
MSRWRKPLEIVNPQYANAQFLIYGLIDPRTGQVRYIGQSSKGLEDHTALSAAEIRWIAKGYSLGWPLTNSTSGGDGSGPRSDATRKRISAALKGHSVSKRQRMMIGDHFRGTPLSAEHQALLTEHDVVQIRKAVAEGASQISLARAHQMSRTSISNIVLYKSWKHV